MPENSTPKEVAYQVISDELMLDGKPRLNLASFVTTWMEPECDKLIMDSMNKNYVDMDEYPVTTELQVYIQSIHVYLISIHNTKLRDVHVKFLPACVILRASCYFILM